MPRSLVKQYVLSDSSIKYGLEFWDSYHTRHSFVQFRLFTDDEKKGYNPSFAANAVVIKKTIKEVDGKFEKEIARLIFDVSKYEKNHRIYNTLGDGLVIELSKAEFDRIYSQFQTDAKKLEETTKLKQKQKQEETKLKEQAAFTLALEQAKKTGKQVYYRTVGGYDGDRYSDDELGWVNINEYVTPDGKIIKRLNPSY